MTAAEMATTALFAEIVVVGLETGGWLLLLALLVTGPIKVDHAVLKDWATSLTAVGLAVAYILGILADRLADSLYDGFRETRLGRLVNRYWGEDSQHYETPAGVSKMRLTVMKESAEVARFLDYQRSRLRIARGTVLNLVVGVPVSLLYLAVRRMPGSVILAVVAAGFGLTAVAVFTSERIHSAYLKRLSDAYRLVMRDRNARK